MGRDDAAAHAGPRRGKHGPAMQISGGGRTTSPPNVVRHPWRADRAPMSLGTRPIGTVPYPINGGAVNAIPRCERHGADAGSRRALNAGNVFFGQLGAGVPAASGGSLAGHSVSRIIDIGAEIKMGWIAASGIVAGMQNVQRAGIGNRMCIRRTMRDAVAEPAVTAFIAMTGEHPAIFWSSYGNAEPEIAGHAAKLLATAWVRRAAERTRTGLSTPQCSQGKSLSNVPLCPANPRMRVSRNAQP